MSNCDVSQLPGLNANVGAHDRIGLTVIRDNIIGAFRNHDDIASRYMLCDRTAIARFELAALVYVEGDLTGRNAHVADLAFYAQSARRQLKFFVYIGGAQFYRFDRGSKSETDVYDVGAGRKHKRGRGRLVFLDQLEISICIGLSAIDAPGQASPDRQRLLAKAGTKRERNLTGGYGGN